MASGNTNYHTTTTEAQTGWTGTTTSSFGQSTAQSIDTTSTLGHTYSGHKPAHTMEHKTTTEHQTGFKDRDTSKALRDGEHVSQGTGLKDEFVGGLKQATGTVFCNKNLKAAGHEQLMLGKEEVAAAKASTGIVGDKGTAGTAAGAHALDDKDRGKAAKKAEKEQLKDAEQLEKDRIKAEKKAAKERAKLEKGHTGGHKFEKGHKLEKGHKDGNIKNEHVAHTEPFVGRVDRLNANYGNPHVEPHIAAMMAHGMPLEGIQAPTSTAFPQPGFVEKSESTTTTWPSGTQTQQWASSERPLPGSTQPPMASGFVGETRVEEIVKPGQSTMPSSQTFAGQSGNQFGSTTFKETSTFTQTGQGNKFDKTNNLNVSPRSDRLNVSPRKMPISPRHCDAARLETSPRHMAQV